ncbi:MAG: hypothetical protein ACLTBP_04380 [Frisingicoccus sp.]
MFADWLQDHQIIPEELSADVPVLYALGQNEIKFRTIKNSPIQSKRNGAPFEKPAARCSGDHLDIDYFNADEICIRGHIVSITYQGG